MSELFYQTMCATLCYRQNDEHHVNDKQISTKNVKQCCCFLNVRTLVLHNLKCFVTISPMLLSHTMVVKSYMVSYFDSCMVVLSGEPINFNFFVKYKLCDHLIVVNDNAYRNAKKTFSY